MKRLIVNKVKIKYDAIHVDEIRSAEHKPTRVDRDDLFAMSFCYSPHPD